MATAKQPKKPAGYLPAAQLQAPEPKAAKTGRPPKPTRPPLPDFPMTPFEKQWFDYFIYSYEQAYPDLTDTDKLALLFAAMEFITYLRVKSEEFETGQTISQARQHPGVQMRAWLDSLSVNRKDRLKQKPKDDADDVDMAELMKFMAG